MNNLGENLIRYSLKSWNRLFLDFETENLNGLFNRPTEASWILDSGDETKEFQFFPYFDDISVSRDAARITNFSFFEYKKNGCDPKIVCDKLDEIIYDPKTLIIWQNGTNFDCLIYNNLRRHCNKKSDWTYLKRSVDTSVLQKAIKLNIQPPGKIGSSEFLAWNFRLSSFRQKGLKTNLDFMAREYGLLYDESKRHGGLFDVKLTRDVFMKQIWRINLEV